MLAKGSQLVMLFSLLLASYAGATWGPVAGDEERSKKELLISGQDYKQTIQKPVGQQEAVVTVVYKKRKGKPTHVALVFEYANPENYHEVELAMVHVSTEDDCCGKGPLLIHKDNRSETLVKIHEAEEYSNALAKKIYAAPKYSRFASFVVPQKYAMATLRQVEKDREAHNDGKFSWTGSGGFNCTTYVVYLLSSMDISLTLQWPRFSTRWTHLESAIKKYSNNKGVNKIDQNKLPKYSVYKRKS